MALWDIALAIPPYNLFHDIKGHLITRNRCKSMNCEGWQAGFVSYEMSVVLCYCIFCPCSLISLPCLRFRSKVYMADLESGLHFLLRIELASHQTLEGKELETFKDFVTVIAKVTAQDWVSASQTF